MIGYLGFCCERRSFNPIAAWHIPVFQKAASPITELAGGN